MEEIEKKDVAHDQDQSLEEGVSRRNFMKTAGKAGLGLAMSTGWSLFGGKAPAFIQPRSIRMLAWGHILKEADVFIQDKIASEFEQLTGVKMVYETINANDIPARATAAIESGTGPDIFQLQWNQPHLYAAGLENVDDLVQEAGGDQIYSFQREACLVDGVYRGVPYYSLGNATVYRKDIFQEAGVEQPPKTWEEYLQTGAKLKRFGMPVGQALSHTWGDAPIFAYPLLWSYGGMEVDANGKVAINSQETLTAIEFCKEFWYAACDESGTAWDDVSNNRAFVAETISATLNAASIYLTARHNPENAPPGFADKLGHFLNPAGPKGQYHTLATYSNCIMKYSKNKEACREFIRFLIQKANYETYITIQKGYGLGFSPDWENHPLWKKDPALEPFRQVARLGRNFGFAGPYNRQASEVQAKYIVIDLFARVIKGESAKSIIAWAEQELKNIYERG